MAAPSPSDAGETRLTVHHERPERVLVIVAHPDDADFGVAGTVAAWVARGTVAELVCCTSGDAGADDAETDPLELARLREKEQRDAAAIVGYDAVTFLHRPDGALANDLALREQLVRILRRVRPDAVVAPDPRVFIHAGRMVNHVDHRTAGAAAIDAVYPASENAMAFPHLVRSEGLAPHHVSRLYLFWSEEPDIAVDIGATLETKRRAVRAHASQIREPAGLDGFLGRWAASEGARAGIDAAESFSLVDLG
jgi:LmbE family N-acetylglucosaminyl deacetylase